MGNVREIKSTLVTVPYKGWHIEKLKEALGPAKIYQVSNDDKEGIAEALKEAEVAILQGDLTDLILTGKNLKWIHCDHAGINMSARPEVFERGIILTGSAGRSGPVLAEHIFFLTLSLIYKSHALHDAQKEHRWRGIPGYDDLRGLYGKTMGIIGLGYTGKELAKRAKAFGMRVLGYDRDLMDVPQGVDKLYLKERGENIEELLRESDVVALSIRLSDETYHMINAETLAMMKSSAFLINMSRGSVVDEPALLDALKRGIIGGAGSDVFETEPLPAESPLWDAPNFVMTPHCTPEMPDIVARSLEVICENVKRFRQGMPLINAIDTHDVYTKWMKK